jgi:riboflavin biosynthesis pyrimidine reductase/predicted DsbA family dithiol-disulfide isomerase
MQTAAALGQNRAMGPTIPVAHDFSCPWCFIGMFHARRLRRDFGATIEWRAYELYPEGMDLPGVRPPAPKIPNRPDTPIRIELALAAEGLDPLDLSKDSATRTHKAHEAMELAKAFGVQDELLERIYFAYWRQNRDIDSTVVLLELARGLIPDLSALQATIEEKRFGNRITPYNQPAYETGVFNLPTVWIGESRYAEQPYRVLRAAMGASMGEHTEAPYASLEFPAYPASDRPHVAINMVSTIDGKTVSGGRDEGVMDLGSRVDHAAMRNIETAAEAVMIGAQTLRATPKVRFDPRLFRIVLSRSGRLDPNVRFFSEAPTRAIVATPESVALDLPEGVRHWTFPGSEVPAEALLARIRTELGVSRLLCEGGSELNAALLAADLADELFLTVAPKVRLGRGLPTYAGGEALPKGSLLDFGLVSEVRIGDEVFLRYRRDRT